MLQPAPTSQADIVVAYLRAGSLADLTDVDRPRMWASPVDLKNYTVSVGDLLIAEGGDVGRAEFAPQLDETTIIQNSLHRVRTSRGDIRFVRYVLAAIYGSGWFDVLCNRATFSHLTVEKLSALPVPWPEKDHQRAIADYLDAETARIDALIAKKRRLVNLVAERFRAFVTSITGVGDHVRVRHITTVRTSGPRGWADLAGESGAPFIRSANLRRESIALRSEDLLYVDPPESQEAGRSRVEAGDVVIGITGANTGWVGLVGPDMAGGFVSQHVALLRPAGIEPAWLAYALFSSRSQDQLLGGQYGGTKQQLGLEDLAELHVAVPSREEQRAGVARVAKSWNATSRSIERLNRQITLLLEHRQSLITAAVTGELAVPGVAA